MDRNWWVVPFVCILIKLGDNVSQKVLNCFDIPPPDYYNYYYGSYYQNPEAADSQEGLNTAATDGPDGSEGAEVSTPNEAAAVDESGQPDSSVTVKTEVSFIKKLVISYFMKKLLDTEVQLQISGVFTI